MSSQPQPEHWITSSLTVESAEGLHARPAIKVSRFARRFAAVIQFRLDGKGDWVDAKSVAKVIGLHAEAGRVIEMRAAGEDARAALAGIDRFFASDFTEPEPDPR